MINVSFYGNSIYMNPVYSAQRVSAVSGVDSVSAGRLMPDATKVHKSGELEGPKECKTCERRKYKDGSDENDVSFQTPQHIDPENSAARVMSHELEHVANAREEGMKENKELLSATVSLKIGVCPECGRTYVAGGETNTLIKTTYDDKNPYDKGRKTVEASFLSGMNVDYSA
ncbi:MAG: hypothetical protein K5656_03650 [Lachnospiraceae bacterium]|nr:hypothetical protein [Lachnospiraceae bacterium]